MHISEALYYQRRYTQEIAALKRAVTPEAAARRVALASSFAAKLKGIGMVPTPPLGADMGQRQWILELE